MFKLKRTTASCMQLGLAYLLVFLSCCNFYWCHPSLFHVSIPASFLATSHGESRKLQSKPESNSKQNRILYVVTSIHEFDDGRRETTLGYDRFSNTVLPIMVESISSMIKNGYDVDAYLITHYPLSDARHQQLRVSLPCGFAVWDDATPLGYAVDHSTDHIQGITRALARQHRYVIKDKIFHYDLFVNFEDDMLIKGAHVDHFLSLTNELFRLRKEAPEKISPDVTPETALGRYYGEMTKTQLKRAIPGFMRVEAAIRGFKPRKKNLYAQIPISYDWNGRPDSHIDPSVCCHVSEKTSSEQIPLAPSNNDLFFWETSIDVLGVRKFPERSSIDWVLLLAGNTDEVYPKAETVIGDYWSGRDHGYFGDDPRPPKTKSRYSSNQGGWMLTKRQIFEMHIRWCREGFLPPYDKPVYPSDGLDTRTVEYWSGGIQIIGVKACNMQRILSMDPDGFSRHLLYHTSNNKQRARNVRYRFSGRTVDQFWGQLNTVRKNAEEAMNSNGNIPT